MLCQFQVYSKVIQLYIYMYLFFLKFFSHLGCYIILSRVPCAIQQVLVGYPFYLCIHLKTISIFYEKSMFCEMFIFLIYFFQVQLTYSVVIISAIQQSDSVIHIYIYILFHILFHYDLSQDIEYSSLCYTVGPCCLSYEMFYNSDFSLVFL